MDRRIVLAGILIVLATPGAAQQAAKVYHLAVVFPASKTVAAVSESDTYKTLLSELRAFGYVEGQNLVVERWAGGGRPERYSDLARDVVKLKPDLIFARSTPMVLHLKAATTMIPIVAFTGGDPVAQGLVASLARPGGNITGFSGFPAAGLQAKALELMREAVPTALRIAFLVPKGLWNGLNARAIREAARHSGVTLVAAMLGDPIDELEYRRVFADLRRDRVHAVIVGDYTENFEYMRVIADLATQSRLPSICPWKAFVETGGLMSYGPYTDDRPRQAAAYIDRILRGANPGELPYQQATKFEFAINLKTAKALALTIPPSLRLRADHVIE